QRRMLAVVEIVEQRLAVWLDVHHHPEDIRRLSGEGGVAAYPLIDGAVTIHRLRSDLAGPASGLAGRLEGGALEHGGVVQLVGGEIPRLGRGRLSIATRASHTGRRPEVRHVLGVVDLVERALVIMGHVHAYEEERVRRAHRCVPADSMTRAPAFFDGPMNSTMLPSGSLTKTWRSPVGPEMTSRHTSPSFSIFAAVASQSSVHSAKCGWRASIFSRSTAGRTSASFRMMCSCRSPPRLYQIPGKSKAGRAISSKPSTFE